MEDQENKSESLRPLRSGRARWKQRARIATTAAVACVMLAVVGFRATVAWLPYSSAVVTVPQRCTWIEDRNGESLGAFVPSSGQWNLPLEQSQISPHLLNAIVAIEDRRFYTHHGVDWRSVAGAVWQDVLHLSEQRGASTLSMQLYRLSHPQPRSMGAKLMQAVRAEQIEQRLSKQQILVDYLNAAPFGGNLVGAGAASWRYFDKPCKDLSLAQAALLAGLPQNPNELRPDRFPQRAFVRRNKVLDDMLALGLIDPAQHDRALAEPIDAQWHSLPQDRERASSSTADSSNPDGLMPLLTELARHHAGDAIRTTIDLKIQRQASARAAEALLQLAPSRISAAAVVVLDTPTADCLASESLSLVSRWELLDLTACPRSSGSTLKPFIYAAAFAEGICTPQSILNDSPTAWHGYEPRNYDRQFAGPISAADALSQSRNVPAMSLLAKVGVRQMVNLLATAGLDTLSKGHPQYGLPLAIGGADVTPMELAQGYATLARGGVHRTARVLISPENAAADDTDQPTSRSHFHRAFTAASCRAALDCLADQQRTEQECPAAAALFPAWKTGTSSGHRDAWCAVVTPRRTVVVWLGNANGVGSDALIGQDVAAPLALEILSATDPGGVGFVPQKRFRLAAQTGIPAAVLDVENIAMISPVDGEEIVRDPSLPSDQQRVSLRAAGASSPHLWWFVDQDYVGESDSDHPLWWNPVPGQHAVRVLADGGLSAVANITIR